MKWLCSFQFYIFLVFARANDAVPVQQILMHLNPGKVEPPCANGAEECLHWVSDEPTVPESATVVAVSSTNDTVCLTDRCHELGAAMKMAMNESAEPCENFYEYACGNWTSYNRMPDDQTKWGNIQAVTEKVTVQLREVLEKNDSADISTARQKARTMYRACMDLERMDSLGRWPLFQLLQSTLGSWPVLSKQWDASQFRWLDVIKRTKKLGFGFFVEFAGSSDPENPKRNMIHFVEGSLGMGSRKMYLSEQAEHVRNGYRALMRNILVLMRDEYGVLTEDEMTNLQADADEIYEFETLLANISRSEEDRRNLSLSLNKMTLRQFHIEYLDPTMNLKQLMEYMVNIMPNSTLKALIKPDMIINVANPRYFKLLHSILADYQLDSKKQRVIANYFGWKITMEFAAKLTQRLRDVVEAYTQTVTGSKQEPERWKTCSAKTNSVMNTAVGSLYIRNFFDESSKPKIAALVKDIRASFGDVLKNADWMDEITRRKALEKLDSMNEYIAFADYIIDDIPKLDREYENLVLGQDHVYNCINSNKFAIETNLKDLLKVNNRSLDDVLSPADVNAFYDPSNNIIAFVAGILQLPFYDANRPEYLNYAAIGTVIGHEITHGFDDQGSLFDSTGKFGDWWTFESRARYAMKAGGLVEKYGSYSLPQGRVNGYLTLGENIADCGGLRNAYNAYQLYVERRGYQEPLLPGFQNYTTEQLFFLGVAQDWCGDEREKTARLSLLTASHSPNIFRVNGPLSSMPEFGLSYDCPIGSPMNPFAKAAVW